MSKIFCLIVVTIVVVFSLCSCGCLPDGCYDGRLVLLNNSQEKIFILVNTGFPDTSTHGAQFSAEPGQRKSLAKAGENKWESILEAKIKITLFVFDYNKIDFPRDSLNPYINKKYIVDKSTLDSLDWVLEYP